MYKSWKTDKWWISHYCFEDLALSRISPPKQVRIHDLTLRDGDETQGGVFSIEDKVRMARALDDLGIRDIEVGLETSPNGPEALKAIATEGLAVNLHTMTFGFEKVKEKIDLLNKWDLYGVSVQFMSNDFFIEKMLKTTREEILEKVVDTVTYAKNHGLWVNLFPTDSTRADWGFLSALYKAGVEAHTDCITICDSFGVCNPQGMSYLVRKVKKVVDVPVGVHAHDPYGLGVANALAAYNAGAEIIDTSVNGIALGGGNPPTEEIAMILRVFYGVDLGLKYEKIYSVCKLIERISKISLSPLKPFGGDRIFQMEWGMKINARKLGEPLAALSYHPSIVGQKLKLILGKRSDITAIEEKMKEIGVSATEKQKGSILDKVKKLVLEKNRPISDLEFKGIVQKIISKL